MKDYLRRFGQYVTGNKEALIKRAVGVRKLNLKDKMIVEMEDCAGNSERRNGKRTTPLGETISDPKGLINWSMDVSVIPDFCENDIYN